MKKYIEPNLASGFRDYLPADAAAREWMVETIKTIFKRFGFVPLETPGVEQEEILTGGDPNFKKQLFKLNLGGQDEKTALRFDLTVPLARVVASYSNELPKPFKRYQIGSVWRGERAQAGRFREFMQFDADIVGASGVAADAEIISLMYETLSALGFKKFLIRVNDRKVLNSLSEYADFPKEKTEKVLRIMDKLDKLGWNGVESELASDSGGGLKENSIKSIKKFLGIKGKNKDVLKEATELFKNCRVAEEGVMELENLAKNVEALGVPEKNWAIDFSVARGLGYYTGPVFEAILTDYPELGSIFAGGRYDDLVSRFGSADIPATGASVGVDRLFVALKKFDLFPDFKSPAQVLVLNFDDDSEKICENLASDLRRNGVSTEIYLGQEKNLKGQLNYAVKQNFPVVLIIGEEERKKKIVQIKNMRERAQEAVPREDVLNYLRNILNT
ncbi:histidine--tRNA ligase [bacterium]|nr:MAG: histidine--tRNA ligase [bacterium]